jgi:hypothetical protein
VVIFRACQLAEIIVVLFLDANNLPLPGSHAARSLDRTCPHRENP